MEANPPGDLVWPSTNALDIPDLDIRVQATGLPAPFVNWGSRSRGKRMRGTFGFYADDYRFEALWRYPERVLACEPTAIVEPNYSVFDQTPVAVAVWATYRKRWLSRFWAEHGVQVFVDLNVSETHSKLNLLGVPHGWQSYATHGYAERLGDLDRELALAVEHGGGSATLLVYGGGQAVADWCASRLQTIHVPEGKRSVDWAAVEREAGMPAPQCAKKEATNG